MADHDDVSVNDQPPVVVNVAVDRRSGGTPGRYDGIVVRKRKGRIGRQGRYPCSLETPGKPSCDVKVLRPYGRTRFFTEGAVGRKSKKPAAPPPHRIQEDDDVTADLSLRER